MNLWLSAHLLFAVLFLSSSAPTPDECQPLVTPLSLADPSVMYGKVILLSGYSDHDTFKALLNVTESSWIDITGSPSRTSEISISEGNKMSGTCFALTVNSTIEGNTVTGRLPNMTSVFHVLPSCDGCLLLSFNSTVKNFKQLVRSMRINDANIEDELHGRTLYLFSRTPNVTDSDMEHFKKQASCLGFSGEPDFVYNPEKGLCKEDESTRMSFD